MPVGCLLYGAPLLLPLLITDTSIIGFIVIVVIGSIFGALFSHSLADLMNYAGVWLGIFKIKGFLKWDSFWGNAIFKIIGSLLLFTAAIIEFHIL